MRNRAPLPDSSTSDDRPPGAEPAHETRLEAFYLDGRHSLIASIRRIASSWDRLDVVHDVFKRLLEGGKLGHVEEPRRFLGRSVRNEALLRLRRRKRHDARSHLLASDDQAPCEQSPEHACELAQQQALLRRSIAALPDDQRMALTLVIFAEMSVAEVAARMRLEDHQVRRLVTRARLRLDKDFLAAWGDAHE